MAPDSQGPLMSLHIDLQLLYALTKKDVTLQFGGAALEKAQVYYQDGRVYDISITGATLYGSVEESAYESHGVSISVQEGDVYVGCTCEHDSDNPVSG